MPLSPNAIVMVSVVTPFLVVAIVAVVLRLHVRVALLRNSGVDDWLCVAAVCCALGTYLANMAGVVVGFGNPLPSMTPGERDVALKTLWISPPLWGLSSALIKTSILTSYTRIWSSKRFKIFIWTLVGTISAFGLTLFFGGVFACVPVSQSWTPPSPDSRGGGGGCIDLPEFMFATSVLNTVADLAVLAIPVPLLRKLKIAARQRAALTAVFSVGVVVCAASVMRLITLHDLKPTDDPSTAGIPLGVWSGVELNLAIICACLPTLRPVLARIFPRLLGPTVDRSSSARVVEVEMGVIRTNPPYVGKYGNSYMDLD